MRRYLLWPYQIYIWPIFVPYICISTLFWGFWAVVLNVVLGPRRASMICGTSWARLIGYLTPMFATVKGRENIEPRDSYVVVSNHQSQYDIILLYGWIGIDFKWVMKKELRKVPILGYACEKLGHVYIDRSNRSAALASLNEAKQRVRGGTSVIFFPEGTRSRTGEVGEFKKGAFRMALDLGLPILPVSISGTKDILPAKGRLIFPGRVEMTVHAPIDTNIFDKSTLPALIARTRDTIRSALP